MKALILAAGRGERLRPLTDERPKPMIEIAGTPILERNVALLRQAGITEIIVNLHYRSETITSYFGDGSRFGVHMTYAHEPELLGTAGAARNVAQQLGDETFLIVYGDNLSTIDLRALLALHRETRALLTMALYERSDPRASGIVGVDDASRVTRFLEKPAEHEIFSHWVNAGYYAVEPAVLAAIPSRYPSDFGRDVLPALLAADAHITGYRMTEQLWWIDSLPDYERTAAAFAKPSV